MYIHKTCSHFECEGDRHFVPTLICEDKKVASLLSSIHAVRGDMRTFYIMFHHMFRSAEGVGLRQSEPMTGPKHGERIKNEERLTIVRTAPFQ